MRLLCCNTNFTTAGQYTLLRERKRNNKYTHKEHFSTQVSLIRYYNKVIFVLSQDIFDDCFNALSASPVHYSRHILLLFLTSTGQRRAIWPFSLLSLPLSLCVSSLFLPKRVWHARVFLARPMIHFVVTEEERTQVKIPLGPLCPK